MTSIPPIPDFQPPTAPAGRVWQTAANTIETMDAFWQANGAELPGTARVITPYDVDYDDPDGLVGISVPRLRPGEPGIPSLAAVRANTMYSIECAIHVIRPTPPVDETGRIANDLTNDYAEAMFLDWWLLFMCITLGTGAGFAGQPGALQGTPFRGAMIQEIIPAEPQGALAGMVAHVTLQLV